MEKVTKESAVISLDSIVGITELRYNLKGYLASVKTGKPLLLYRGRKNNLVLITEEEYQKFTEYQQTLKK